MSWDQTRGAGAASRCGGYLMLGIPFGDGAVAITEDSATILGQIFNTMYSSLGYLLYLYKR